MFRDEPLKNEATDAKAYVHNPPPMQSGCDSQVGTAAAGMPEDFALSELFRYHAPDLRQLPMYENIREAGRHFAKVILVNVPHGADRRAAIRKIREAVMTANAGVALSGYSPGF